MEVNNYYSNNNHNHTPVQKTKVKNKGVTVKRIQNLYCEECAKVFPSGYGLSRHKKKVHSQESSKFLCDICLAVTCTSKKEWEEHRQNHLQGNYPCSVCKKIFTEVAGLVNHQEIYSHKIPNPNEHQDLFTSSQLLTQGPVTVIPQFCCCPICKNGFTNDEYLKVHLKSEHLEQLAFHCERCDDIFLGQSSYNAHKLQHKRVCPICDKEFENDSANYKSHVSAHRKHQIQEIYVCEICRNRNAFLTINALLIHKKTHDLKSKGCVQLSSSISSPKVVKWRKVPAVSYISHHDHRSKNSSSSTSS